MSTFDREQFDALIEAYVDDEVSPSERGQLEAFVASDPDARDELQLARTLKRRLGALPQPQCPPDVTRAVLSAARSDVRRTFVERLRAAMAASWTTVVRPSLAVGVLVAVVVGGALITMPADDPAPTEAVASTEEVDRALDEAKWALAYISNLGRETATSIRDDVLDERVVRPVNRALEAAFDDPPSVQ